MKLYFVNGDRRGQFWELAPPGICIGREEDNDIQLLLPGISRYHAKIEYNGTQWRILDLGSTNGTKVDGKVIEGAVDLKDGMQLSLGEQVIRFIENAESVPAPEKEDLSAIRFSMPDMSDPQDLPPAREKTSPSPAAEMASPEKEQTVSAKPSVSMMEPPPFPPPAAESSKEVKSAFQKISGDIFGKKAGQKNMADPSAQQAVNPKKRVHNLLFFLLVTVLVCGVIFVFAMLNTAPQKRTVSGRTIIRNAFILEYEKKLKSEDNVFRFYVRVEENSALFKLNDLRHGRHFTKGIGQVDQTVIDSLVKAVQQTDFMKITSDPAGKPRDGVDDYRKLTIGYNSSFNSVVNHNTFPKRSFEEIEFALDNFAAEFGLKTIALSEKQMIEEADQSFAKAEELFKNYQARPENLRNAKLRYQIAVDFLDQFEPKPKNWIIAKRRLAETEKLLTKMKKDAEFNINLYYKRRQYSEAVGECNRMLLILDPEDRNYQKIRNLKIALEKRIDPRKSRSRR